MDIHERLAILISTLGETPVSFSEKLGIQRSSVSHLLSARNKPSVDFLEKLLLVYPSVNLSWLISGLGTLWASPEVPAPAPEISDTGKNTADISSVPSGHSLPEPVEKEYEKGKKPSKVILFYPDATFEVFYP